jgi:hypothetical protein
MPNMKATRRNIKRASSGGSVSSPKTMVREAPRHHIGGIRLQAVVFLLAFLIVWSRRPDAILNANFSPKTAPCFIELPMKWASALSP